jgi:hypothetical protein
MCIRRKYDLVRRNRFNWKRNHPATMNVPEERVRGVFPLCGSARGCVVYTIMM